MKQMSWHRATGSMMLGSIAAFQRGHRLPALLQAAMMRASGRTTCAAVAGNRVYTLCTQNEHQRKHSKSQCVQVEQGMGAAESQPAQNPQADSGGLLELAGLSSLDNYSQWWGAGIPGLSQDSGQDRGEGPPVSAQGVQEAYALVEEQDGARGRVRPRELIFNEPSRQLVQGSVASSELDCDEGQEVTCRCCFLLPSLTPFPHAFCLGVFVSACICTSLFACVLCVGFM